MYASFLKIRAPCIRSFLLCRLPWRLLTKSSLLLWELSDFVNGRSSSDGCSVASSQCSRVKSEPGEDGRLSFQAHPAGRIVCSVSRAFWIAVLRGARSKDLIT